MAFSYFDTPDENPFALLNNMSFNAIDPSQVEGGMSGLYLLDALPSAPVPLNNHLPGSGYEDFGLIPRTTRSELAFATGTLCQPTHAVLAANHSSTRPLFDPSTLSIRNYSAVKKLREQQQKDWITRLERKRQEETGDPAYRIMYSRSQESRVRVICEYTRIALPRGHLKGASLAPKPKKSSSTDRSGHGTSSSSPSSANSSSPSHTSNAPPPTPNTSATSSNLRDFAASSQSSHLQSTQTRTNNDHRTAMEGEDQDEEELSPEAQARLDDEDQEMVIEDAVQVYRLKLFEPFSRDGDGDGSSNPSTAYERARQLERLNAEALIESRKGLNSLRRQKTVLTDFVVWLYQAIDDPEIPSIKDDVIDTNVAILFLPFYLNKPLKNSSGKLTGKYGVMANTLRSARSMLGRFRRKQERTRPEILQDSSRSWDEEMIGGVMETLLMEAKEKQFCNSSMDVTSNTPLAYAQWNDESYTKLLLTTLSRREAQLPTLVRAHAVQTSQLATLARGDTIRQLQLSHIFSYPFKSPNTHHRGPIKGLMLAFNSGKILSASTKGTKDSNVIIPHRIPAMCAYGAMGLLLVYQYQAKNGASIFDRTKARRKEWEEEKAGKRTSKKELNERERRAVQRKREGAGKEWNWGRHASYSQVYALGTTRANIDKALGTTCISEIWDGVGNMGVETVASSAVLRLNRMHFARKVRPKDLAAMGVPYAIIKLIGFWANGSYEEDYADRVPVDGIQALAGFRVGEAYFVARMDIEVPYALQALVFPDVEKWRAEVAASEDAGRTDTAQMLKLLEELRPAVIIHLAALYQEVPESKLFQGNAFPLFTKDDDKDALIRWFREEYPRLLTEVTEKHEAGLRNTGEIRDPEVRRTMQIMLDDSKDTQKKLDALVSGMARLSSPSYYQAQFSGNYTQPIPMPIPASFAPYPTSTVPLPLRPSPSLPLPLTTPFSPPLPRPLSSNAPPTPPPPRPSTPPPPPTQSSTRPASFSSPNGTTTAASTHTTSPSPPSPSWAEMLLPPLTSYSHCDLGISGGVRREPVDWEEAFDGIVRPELLWDDYKPKALGDYATVMEVWKAWRSDRIELREGTWVRLPALSMLEDYFKPEGNGKGLTHGWRMEPKGKSARKGRWCAFKRIIANLEMRQDSSRDSIRVLIAQQAKDLTGMGPNQFRPRANGAPPTVPQISRALMEPKEPSKKGDDGGAGKEGVEMNVDVRAVEVVQAGEGMDVVGAGNVDVEMRDAETGDGEGRGALDALAFVAAQH